MTDIAEENVLSRTQVKSTEPETATERKHRDWQYYVERVSYQGLVRNTPFLIFLTILSVLYIANNNKAIQLTRAIAVKTKELKELKWKHMDLQSRLMYQTSQSQLAQRTEAIGLRPLEQPAFQIQKPAENQPRQKQMKK